MYIYIYIQIIYINLPNSNICRERVSVSFSIPNVIFWLQKSMSSTTSKVLPSFPTSTQQLTAVHDSLMLQAVVPLILNNDSFVGHSTKCMKIHYHCKMILSLSFDSWCLTSTVSQKIIEHIKWNRNLRKHKTNLMTIHFLEAG